LRGAMFQNQIVKSAIFDQEIPDMDKIASRSDGLKKIPAVIYRDFKDRL
jgi:hypothetical protein